MYWTTEAYSAVPLADPQYGLSGIQATIEDGFFSCTFLRSALTTISPPGAAAAATNTTFDLENTPYYLFLALGPLDGQGHIGQHIDVIVSGDKVNLSTYGSVGTASHILVTLHAGRSVMQDPVPRCPHPRLAPGSSLAVPTLRATGCEGRSSLPKRPRD